MMSGRRTGQVLLMNAGLLAWAVQFTLIYAITSTLCGRGWADATLLSFEVVPAAILSATLVTFAATAIALVLSLRAYRRVEAQSASVTDDFLSHAAILINGYSLIVILWHGVPAFILPACA
jgi:multisubunit Na+/H+ antiporter MnhC subunit